MGNYFFNPNKEGSWVLLSLEEELFNELGKEIKQNFEDFLKAIKEPKFQESCYYDHKCKYKLSDFTGKVQNPINNTIALHKFYLKHDKDLIKTKTPPFFAFLCFFIVPMLHDEKNYYKPLNQLLNLNNEGMPKGFEEIPNVFVTLEDWSLQNEGKLGLFLANSNFIHERYINVGTIWTQSLLRPSDKEILKIIFYGYQGIKGRNISKQELRYLIINSKPFHLLRKKIKDILKDDNPNNKTKKALLQIIQNEYSDWDGKIDEKFISYIDKRELNLDARGHISLKFQETKLISVRLRFQIYSENLKGKITFNIERNKLLIKVRNDDWSSPAYTVNQDEMEAEIFDATKILFENVYIDSEKLKSVFHSKDILYFQQGGFHNGLNNDEFIQNSQLSVDEINMVITTKNNKQYLSWSENPENYKNQKKLQHPQSGKFDLFVIQDPKVDIISLEPIVNIDDVLIEFIDGIKKPNTKKSIYFFDVPPTILIKPKDNYKVFLGGTICSIDVENLCEHKILKLKNNSLNEYSVRINKHINHYYESQLEIIVKKEDQILARKQIKFIKTIMKIPHIRFKRDLFFNQIENEDKFVDFFIYRLRSKFPLEFGINVTFIGLQPGEICRFNLKKPVINTHKKQKTKYKFNKYQKYKNYKRTSDIQLYQEEKAKLELTSWNPIWAIIHQINEKLEFIPLNTKKNRNQIIRNINQLNGNVPLGLNGEEWKKIIINFKGMKPKSISEKMLWDKFSNQVLTLFQ